MNARQVAVVTASILLLVVALVVVARVFLGADIGVPVTDLAGSPVIP